MDLIKHLQKWKDAAKYMRDLMDSIEKQVNTIKIIEIEYMLR